MCFFLLSACSKSGDSVCGNIKTFLELSLAFELSHNLLTSKSASSPSRCPTELMTALRSIEGIKTDEVNRYSIRIELIKSRQPHLVPEKINEEQYEIIKRSHEGLSYKPLSVIIPVKNEQDLLPDFCAMYSAVLAELKTLGVQVETIFVTNGSTDTSSQIIDKYVEDSNGGSIRLIESDEGIYKAFVAGIKSKSFLGHIAKIDVDTKFDYWTLPLMLFELVDKPEKEVLYAEIRPKEETPNRFNMSEFYQEFRTERLYYHGRMSLYRENPFDSFPEEIISKTGVLVEDMILSCLYVYYKGLNSVGPANGAVVRSLQPTSFDKSIRKFDRSRSEITKIEGVFPHLKLLSPILKRTQTVAGSTGEIDPEDIKLEMWKAYELLHQAMTQISRLDDGVTSEVKEWERLR